MKEKYKVCVTETLKRECEIEAASEEEALQLLEDKYKNSEIVLDYSDLVDTEFSNCGYNKKEIQILNQISEFCKNECGSCNCCCEDECILYRIEKIIEDGFYDC